MTKMKTVLVVFAALVLADNAYSQLRRPVIPLSRPVRRGMAKAPSATSKEEGQHGIPGVTAPFVPFGEKDKIKYEEAVERAKKNDSEGFYWLTYYFLNGDGVVKNSDAAGKFLQKAVDLGNAKACYLLGLYHNECSLTHEHGGNSPTKRLRPLSANNVLTNNVLIGAGINGRIASLQIPKQKTDDPQKGNHGLLPNRLRSLSNRPQMSNRPKRECCFTNEVMTGYVIGLFSSAAKGGLVYATNDIARLKHTIDSCRKRIVEEAAKQKAEAALQKAEAEEWEKMQAKSAAALDLLGDPCEEEKRRKQQEKYEQEREYWASWPKTLTDDELASLDSDLEQKFNCVFFKSPDAAHGRTNTWVQGCNKSLVVEFEDYFQKIGTSGQIVAWGLLENRFDLEEYRWYDAEKRKRLEAKRGIWAKDRGMSLEEAMQKYKVWQEQSKMSLPPQPSRLLNLNNRPGLNAPSPNNRQLSGLEIARMRRKERLEEQQRPAAEQAKKERVQEAEARKQATEERKAQLDQLMQIQEELRRQREEKRREQNNMK